MLREDGRKFDEERKIKITKNVNIYAEGSVLIEVGNTKVICVRRQRIGQAHAGI